MLPFFNCCSLHLIVHNLTSPWPVMLLANKRLPYGNQILARIMSLLKSILISEWKIFKYVHVQMALPKKNFKCFQIVLAGAALQIIKNLLVKARWLRSVPKAVQKKLGWSTIFYELKGVVKAKIAQNNSQVSEGGITVRSRFHSWIDYLKSEPVWRFCNL